MFEGLRIQKEEFRISEPEVINGQAAQDPDLAVSDDGTVWVVWSERRREGDLIRLIDYCEGHSSSIRDISAECGVEFQPAIISQSGLVRLLWVAFRGGSWHLVSRVLCGNALEAEEILFSSPEGIFHPRMVIDRDGICWVACEVVERQRPRLFVSRMSQDSWSDLEPVATPVGPCYRPSLARGPGGGVWMSYDCYEDGHYSVYAQRVDRLSEPICVTDDGYQNLQSSLAADRNGNLWIAWSGNRNDAFRDPWWLTKWVYLRHFDGERFSDPLGLPPGHDVYNEDSFQGWEFPEVAVDVAGRVWIVGQSAHTLYAQYYGADGWSPLHVIAPQHWGSWKPRVRIAGHGPLFVASMGLGGAQIQKLDVKPGEHIPQTGPVIEPLPVTRAVPSARLPEKPTIATASGETLTIFFGDLHAHSIYSDATNDVDEFYHRYRDGYGYDFATLTDHDFLDGIELSFSELKMIWNHADRMTVPGEFLAFYGYEWTSPAITEHALPGMAVGEGHRHVLYPDQSGPLVSYGEESANTGKRLLNRLQNVDALVIPHHTSWSGTDWDAHDERLQRVVEICSTHGRFEYPGNKPIGYRRDHIHPDKFVLDALERGYRLGFVGGSDSHGLRWHATELAGRDSHVPAGTRIGWKQDAFRTGMTAILAPVLTRDALYQALYDRRCYATSGVPILVDFRVNGALMGSEITLQGAPHLTVSVKGTAPIRSIDIVRSGHCFGGVQCREGEGVTSLSFTLDDTIIIPGESHYYYARVTQEDGNMAWSSPIWVQVEE